MESLAAWVCRAGPERAIELLGAPSWLCARCAGFYLALALGVALHRVVPARRIGRGPLFLLAIAVALTLVQVASESLLGIASAPLVRLVLGGAVGLPLGWIAGTRFTSAVRNLLGLTSSASVVLATLAFVFVVPSLLQLALVIATCHALAIATLAILAFASGGRLRNSTEGEAT